MLPKVALLCAAACAALVSAAAGAEPPRTPRPGGVIAAPAGTPARVDPASIPMPELAFQPTPEIASNYGKYHFFHRAGTDFDAAYADILECDGYSRGFTNSPSTGDARVPAPYAGTLAGGIGGVLGASIASGIADAIWGSSERRRLRRVNMRTCMEFKGYRAYGLPERLWDQFNFTEGMTAVDAPRRARLLQIQARVASGPTPTVGELAQ
ncbi:MAG TPA: hypothetical protein VF552_15695 [Allosphingosinicella sp.]|jgi:hypothetical protein